MNNEEDLYKAATLKMNDKAKCHLANYMAHDYKIIATDKMTVLEYGDNILIITNDGKRYKGVELM